MGFHQYTTGSEYIDTLVDMEEVQAKDLLFFQQQGVKSEFIDKLFNTQPEDLWYPTVDEMLDAGVYEYNSQNAPFCLRVLFL